jgi:hypothetical protein
MSARIFPRIQSCTFVFRSVTRPLSFVLCFVADVISLCQSMTVRFVCLPESHVECEFKTPSIDMLLSSSSTFAMQHVSLDMFSSRISNGNYIYTPILIGRGCRRLNAYST